MDKYREVLELGVRMRAAQKNYFRGRSPEALALSKKLEREFDVRTDALFNGLGF